MVAHSQNALKHYRVRRDTESSKVSSNCTTKYESRGCMTHQDAKQKNFDLASI